MTISVILTGHPLEPYPPSWLLPAIGYLQTPDRGQSLTKRAKLLTHRTTRSVGLGLSPTARRRRGCIADTRPFARARWSHWVLPGDDFRTTRPFGGSNVRSHDRLGDLASSESAISPPSTTLVGACACSVAAGRHTVASTEHFRKRRRRLIADAGRNAGDGIVARFEHDRSRIHPARDQVAVHWLTDEARKASRESRPAEPCLQS